MSKIHHKDYSWFAQKRFGMFIHWGIYSMAARLESEWIKCIEHISDEVYKKRYVDHFDPDLFNPREWAALAKKAGMRYVVFTAKHHDGYCMYDSKFTDFKYHDRDIFREVAEAFRAEGMNIGVYYSLIDWTHPDFPYDQAPHPKEGQEFKGNMLNYRKYLFDQVRELLTDYGKIDIIWFDGSYNNKDYNNEHIWDMDNLEAMIRELQPGILISRLPGHDDFSTPETTIPQNGLFDKDGTPRYWEGCQVLHGGWGYTRRLQWKTVPELVNMLLRHTSRSGNLLLNVGPTSRGNIDAHTTELLEGLGNWMKFHSKAIYGCSSAPAEFPEPEGCRYTWNPEKNTLYLHLFSWPERRIDLPELGGKIEYAQLLCDGTEIQFSEVNTCYNVHGADAAAATAARLILPISSPENCPVPVIELFIRK